MVREKIHGAAKYARADHLRRMVEQTRDIGPWSAPAWKRAVIRIGQLAWWGSLLISLVWHASAAATETNPAYTFAEEGEFSGMPLERVGQCVRDVYNEHILRPACSPAPIFSNFVYHGLILASLAFWWHPHLHALQWRKTHHCVGKTTFYFLQLLSLGVRASGFYALGHAKILPISLSADATRAAHALVFFSLILVSRDTVIE